MSSAYVALQPILSALINHTASQSQKNAALLGAGIVHTYIKSFRKRLRSIDVSLDSLPLLYFEPYRPADVTDYDVTYYDVRGSV